MANFTFSETGNVNDIEQFAIKHDMQSCDQRTVPAKDLYSISEVSRW